MSSTLEEILEEWNEGCYYSDEVFAEAYTTFLFALLERNKTVFFKTNQDACILAFLKAGYRAWLSYCQDGEPSAESEATYNHALSLVGGGFQQEARPEPSALEKLAQDYTSPPPSPAPSVKEDDPEPQPGPSSLKRAAEGDSEPEADADEPTLKIIETRERYLKRFKSTFREEVVLIQGLGSELPSEELMIALFETMLERQRDAVGAKNTDRCLLEIDNSDKSVKPIWFDLRDTDQVNGRVILDKLVRTLNSNESFMADGKLSVSYIHVPVPNPGGRSLTNATNLSIDQWLEQKIKSKSVFCPSNTDDSMCLARSVVVAKAHGRIGKDAFYRLRKPESVVQQKEALALCTLGNINPNTPCGLDEVRQLQAVMPEYRLCVFTDSKGQECVFKGPYVAGRKNLCLLLHNAHFHAVLYPCQAFGFRFTCEKCVVYYNNPGDHRCADICQRCFGPDQHNEPLKRCMDCRHFFAGDECMNTHKTVKLPHSNVTKCETFKFCSRCQRSYKIVRGIQHACELVYCRNCKQNVLENHLCFMQKWQERGHKDNVKYLNVYYDIETTQCDTVAGKADTFEHKPNMLVCQCVCKQCEDVAQNEYFCTVCGTRQNIFQNLDDPSISVVGQFFDYLQSLTARQNCEILLTAHNARSFDAVFMLQEVMARKLKPNIILQGAKINCMTVGKWKFIDSLMFLPMPLSAIPKSFGLTELKKGYWPYLANNPDFYNHNGDMLAKEYYCVGSMKSQAAKDFDTWYEEQVRAGVKFNFRTELRDYCVSDVNILRQGCTAFRKLFKDIAGFDPMYECITLSSACMSAYRRNFMPENKIGIVPPGGYHGRGKQSHIALKWLDYESFKLGKTIQTIYSHREMRILGRPVDGYVEITNDQGELERRIYQFHGDYWHQCPLHFPPTENSPGAVNRYEETQRITAMFTSEGYKVIEKWECVFIEELRSDPDVIAYFDTHPTTRVPPLRLRDALTGGRTSALRSYHKADLDKGEKIKMVDVISEYPNANLREAYPVGHPQIFLQGNPDMPRVETWNGIMKCTVLPPRDEFIPLLPYSSKGKLLFPLCRTCAEEQSSTLCRHDDPAQRALTGTWCSPELKLAVAEAGYKMLKVHEVYQYPGTMKFNPETGEDGLFSGHIREFMAIKIHASGFPKWCNTPEKQAKFIEDVGRMDGIVLDPTKMGHNAALRTLAKLIVNSFWGKFGEKTLRSTTEFVYDYGELMNIVSDPNKIVQSLLPLSEECLQVTYNPVEDSEESLSTSSILHAAFTTCFGRIQLYKYLKIVNKLTLYHDTDSVEYISRPGAHDLPVGYHLGELSDQIEDDYGPGSFITEFVAGGPKNYAYKVAVGGDPRNVKVCVKVRGITINKGCEDLITFENLKGMVMDSQDCIQVPIPHQIARLPSWKIVTRATSKKWQPVNSKRRRIDREHTVPHGYNAWHGEDEEDQEVLEAMEFME